MITIRKSLARGKTELSWLESFHSFSFASYYDPKFSGFGPLLVINEDRIQAGKGFGKHSHSEMEIISYVVSGTMKHEDSTGTGSIIKPGEIQRMSAGTGIKHSEFNSSNTDLLHLIQIWIKPNERHLTPGYEQKTISQEEDKLILIGSPTGGQHSIVIHQDAEIYVCYLNKDQSLDYKIHSGHQCWLQLIKGEITISDKNLSPGDSAAITEETAIKIHGFEKAEFLLFDLKAKA